MSANLVHLLHKKHHLHWNIFFSLACVYSPEPGVPGDDEDVAAASPEPEPEVEKEAEVAVLDLKAETNLESQIDGHTADDQTEKSSTAPTTEPAAAPTEPTPSAPEENRVGLDFGLINMNLSEQH